MRQFPFAAIILIIGAGICFTMFIMFNYAYTNPDTGLFTILEEHASDWDSSTLQTWFGVRIEHLKTGFGMAGVILFALGIIVAVARSFGSRTMVE